MKTPRAFLLQRHQAQEPQLDALRRSVVSTLSTSRRTGALREFILSLRWHAAGLSTVWAVTAILYYSRPADSSNAVLLTQDRVIKLDAVYLAELRQNQQELRELTEDTGTDDRSPALPPRRSERNCGTEMV